jgi:two-component system, NtrC family, nitrogen regulation sensor histidine kinase NtrY
VSLSGRFLAAALAGAVAAAAAAAMASAAGAAWPAVLASSLGFGVVAAIIAALLAARPVARLLSAVADGVRSFRESDFSLRLAAPPAPELAELVDLFNGLGEVLREKRAGLVQRELLFDTLLSGAPMAILLADERGRVVLANAAARALLGARRSPVGRNLADVAGEGPPFLRESLVTGSNALLAVPLDGAAGGEETFRLFARDFHLHTRRHRLVVVERLTPELRRKEAETWKRVVSVMNHELNNSLAPLSSLVHSARTVAEKGDPARRLPEILGGIEERVRHLARFLEGYSRAARLPEPRFEEVPWQALLEGVRPLFPFRLDGPVPAGTVRVDPAQLTQVLVNLLKNAHEAGGRPEEVTLAFRSRPSGETSLLVLDRGAGMTDEEMRTALLPFVTTKPGGTGLGLPLAVEIVAAHGGALRISRREGGGTAVAFTLPLSRG